MSCSQGWHQNLHVAKSHNTQERRNVLRGLWVEAESAFVVAPQFPGGWGWAGPRSGTSVAAPECRAWSQRGAAAPAPPAARRRPRQSSRIFRQGASLLQILFIFIWTHWHSCICISEGPRWYIILFKDSDSDDTWRTDPKLQELMASQVLNT